MAYTWEDYSDECESCWRAYNAVPRGEPCYQHKNQPIVRRELDDKLKGGTYVWHRDDSPHDFSGDPLLLQRLHFLRWLFRYRVPESEH